MKALKKVLSKAIKEFKREGDLSEKERNEERNGEPSWEQLKPEQGSQDFPKV